MLARFSTLMSLGDLDFEWQEEDGRRLQLKGPIKEVSIDDGGNVIVHLEWAAYRRALPSRPGDGPGRWTHAPGHEKENIGRASRLSFEVEKWEKGVRVRFIDPNVGFLNYIYLRGGSPLEWRNVIGPSHRGQQLVS